AYLKQAESFIRWLAEKEPLPETLDHQYLEKSPSFLKWLFSGEVLEKKEKFLEYRPPHFIPWILKKEVLERKGEEEQDRKNFFRWFFEGDKL
ncbi:MAG: hypothetical protein Q7T11_01490, partial [Deltaproteobacteria bacterium]|nr:hypothetical protein [Deltaproteobacteria bacterium]